MLISLVMVAFQNPDFIGAAIKSILKQSYKQLELIVVCVLGDEPTINKVRVFKDKRVKLILSNYARITHQRNLGVIAAKGKYIMLFDSDDVMCKGAIKGIVQFAEKKRAVIAYPDFRATNDDLTKQKRYSWPKFDYKMLVEEGNYITDVSLVRSKVLKKFIPFKLRDGRQVIYKTWLKIGAVKKYRKRIFHYPRVTFLYRRHSRQTTANRDTQDETKFSVARIGDCSELSKFFTVARGIGPDDVTPLDYAIYFQDPSVFFSHPEKFKFKRIVIHWSSSSLPMLEHLEKFPWVESITHDKKVFDRVYRKGTNLVKLLSTPRDVEEYLSEEDYGVM